MLTCQFDLLSRLFEDDPIKLRDKDTVRLLVESSVKSMQIISSVSFLHGPPSPLT
jgi:hypothetical protein